jgi:hypothetical protein
MNLKITFQIVLILLSFCINVDAQSKKKNQKSKSVKDVEIIDFDSDEKGSKSGDKSPSLYTFNHMIIKTNPFLPIFGKGIVEVEREINDFMSIQVGVGATFKTFSFDGELGDLLGGDFYDEGVCESDLWVNDECDFYGNSEYHKRKVGFLVSVQPRFYFNSEGFEGYYIAPVFKYSYNPYGARSVVETKNALIYSDDFDFDERKTYTDFSARIGAQGLFPRLTSEYFLGGGIRLENSARQDIGRGTNLVYMNGTRKTKESRFFLEFGLRFGFQL